MRLLVKYPSKSSLFVLGGLLLMLHVLAHAAWAQARALIPFEPGDSLEQIEEKIELNGYNFKVKNTWVFALPESERENTRGRRLRPAAAAQGSRTPPASYVRLSSQPLPSAFDLRNVEGRSYIGAVRNQGPLGSCYSFAAAAAAEGTYNLATQSFGSYNADFSESYITWTLPLVHPYGAHFGGGDGADYDYYELLALTSPGAGTGLEGVVSEEDFPYQVDKVTDEMKLGAITRPRVTFDSWSRIYPADYLATTEEIKNAIMSNGVVDAAVYVSSAFDAYASGVYEDSNTAASASPYYYSTTNHAISLVGWDDNPPEGGGGVWILRNSWGDSWGENGYMRIRYFSAAVNAAAAILVYRDALPIAVTGDASSIKADSAVLSGSVNPANDAASYYFEYGPTPELGSATARSSAGAGNAPLTVSAKLSGLAAKMTYYYRLVAENSAGTRYSAVRAFSTLGSPALPVVETGLAAELGTNSAILRGSINPRGAAVAYYLEYGITDSYGSETAAIELSADTAFVSVEQAVSGLLPRTLYHYRLVAASNAGISYGENRVFTTPEIILAEGFETVVPPSAWTKTLAYSSGGTAPDWTFFQSSMCAAQDAVCDPHTGGGMARFNSYSALQENKSRLSTKALDLRGKGNVQLSFWMYRNTWYANPDHIQVQVSTDGSNWLNVGDKCRRYTGEEQWEQCTVSLDYLSGRAGVYVALLGVSAWGDNIYVDDLRITAQSVYELSGRVMENGEGVSGVSISLGGEPGRTTTTDSEGSYSFPGVLNGVYAVTPVRYGYSFSPQYRTQTVAGAHRRDVDFSTLSTQFAVSGNLHGGGEPLGDALLVLTPAGLTQSETGPVYQAVSRGDGSFSFEGVANGYYRLRVELNGILVAEQMVEVSGTNITNLVLNTSEEGQIGAQAVALWNSNLKMINILELSNKAPQELHVSLEVLNDEGVNESLAVRHFSIPAYEQRDLVLNELSSLKADAYGVVRLVFSHPSVDGRMSYYRPAAEGEGWDFSFSLPLGEPLFGASYALSNTYSPEIGPIAGFVTNWLTLVNLSNDAQSFSVKYYNIIGEPLRVDTHSLPAMARRDIDGGHEAFGACASGLIEIEPQAPDAPYLAALSRYGKKTLGDAAYSFAFGISAKRGSGARQLLPVNTAADVLNYLELGNVSDEEIFLTLEYFNAAGQNVLSRTLSLAAHAQQHLAVDTLTDSPFAGSVRLRPSREASLLAGSAVYYYSPGRENLDSAEYSTVLSPVMSRRASSFNLYLNMANWLRVINSSSSMFTVLLTLDRGLASERVIPLTVAAHGRQDFGLHEQEHFGLSSESYGVISLETPRPKDSLFQVLRVIPTTDGTVDAVSSIVVR